MHHQFPHKPPKMPTATQWLKCNPAALGIFLHQVLRPTLHTHTHTPPSSQRMSGRSQACSAPRTGIGLLKKPAVPHNFQILLVFIQVLRFLRAGVLVLLTRTQFRLEPPKPVLGHGPRSNRQCWPDSILGP